MAYKVSQEVISLFKSCYRQIAKIQVLGIEGLDEIKESDIVQGGLTVDRYCFSSNSLEIGTAIASELSLELKNDKGQFDSFSFDGVKLVARIGIKKWDAKTWENAIIHYVPLGVFTVDEPIKNKATVTLNALDNMVKFDRPYDTDLIFPATLGEIAEDACSKCGVLLKTTSFYNSDYVVSSRPTDEELTYRQVIQWVAQLSCTNAFVDWDGQLRFTWFEDSGIAIPPSDRYDSDLEEDSVLITGVKVVTTDDSEYTAGSDDCMFVIEGNSLAQSNPEFIASTIYAQLENFSYRPYSCECRPMPYLFPMDMITFVDTKGNEYKTIVSAITYTMNGSTYVLGEGDGQTKGGYASTGSLTQHERVIIEKAKKAAEKTSTEQFNLALVLNRTISSAFGLYQSEVVENGTSTWYYHDRTTLGDSTIIYVFNSGGFAWTDDWNDGNPVWQYGFTKDGNALYKILSAYKIQAEYIDANTITADKIKAGAIGGFTIDETHIGIGKTSYNDTENDGVYISTSGIGLGKGKFYVTDKGFFHAEEGEFVGNIKGGTININNNFIVDENGSVQLNGGITWGTGSSPTQVLYARSSIAKPDDNSSWSSFPSTSSDSWHKTYSSYLDYYASYTYDGGQTWTDPIKIKGTDASVTDQNVFDALKSNDTMYGCFTARDGKLYINAAYINAGTVSSDFTFTGELVATNANITGSITSSNAVITGGSISLGTSTDKQYLSLTSTGRIHTGLTDWMYTDIDWSGIEVGYNQWSNGCVKARLGSYGGADTGASYFGLRGYVRYAEPFSISVENVDEYYMGSGSIWFYTGSENSQCYGQLSGTWKSSSSITVTSDLNAKNSITTLSSAYYEVFKMLRPVLFKYNDGTSGRLHMGFVAQEVAKAVEKAGLSLSEFAAVCTPGREDGYWGIRYEELVPLNTAIIQQLIQRISELEAKINA